MKNKRLFTYVFLFGLLVNGSACGSDNDETNPPKTPDGENPETPVGLQAYMLTTTDTRTYNLMEAMPLSSSTKAVRTRTLYLPPPMTPVRSTRQVALCSRAQ